MTPKHCPKCGCLMTVNDEGAPYHHGKHWAETDLTFCLKRQLDAAQQRIKRLEEAGNEVFWALCPASTAMMTERERAALKAWNKAKETKP